MVADRYVGERAWSKRIVRERYDVPPPKAGGGIGAGRATGLGVNGDTTPATARTGARSKAASGR
jgi:hypothetical protein